MMSHRISMLGAALAVGLAASSAHAQSQDPYCLPGQPGYNGSTSGYGGASGGIGFGKGEADLWDSPSGARQKVKFGKLWPPFPRPVGKHQPAAHIYHDTHYWPHPYNCQDRETVQLFIELQKYNGWVQATTLFDYHFHPVTHELNPAGRRQLQYILTQVPEQNREVHLAVSEHPEHTQSRVLAVEQTVAALAGPNAVPVLTRVATPYGQPASIVDAYFNAYTDNVPQPFLPNASGGAAAVQAQSTN